MSLDVYLQSDGPQNLRSGPAIFIRENGRTREITREEWDERFPDREPVTVDLPGDVCCHYEANITHNLGAMAEAAGVYRELWRPDEIGITKAKQLIEPLRTGLAKLRSNPDHFRTLNPANGWGDYEGLVAFVADYLKACEAYPDADVHVSR